MNTLNLTNLDTINVLRFFHFIGTQISYLLFKKSILHLIMELTFYKTKESEGVI